MKTLPNLAANVEIGKLYRIRKDHFDYDFYVVDTQTLAFVKLHKRDLILCIGIREPGWFSCKFLWDQKTILISEDQTRLLEKVGRP